MLLSRDYVGYIATELTKRLLANEMIESATPAPALAERTGLEPATSAVTGQHSNQLNYVPRIAS